MDLQELARNIPAWGRELGFARVGICDVDLRTEEPRLLDWLRRGFHGGMDYMRRHGLRRARPAELRPGTVRVIAAAMDYLPTHAAHPLRVLGDPQAAYLSRYALGRDYHKPVRRRLQRLAERLARVAGPCGYRVFCDSAPVLEKALARKAGLGWFGKHTLLLHPGAGSWFFLGEIYTDLPLPVSAPFAADHCGNCEACLRVCPTGAIVAPYRLDARRCISYLTIEYRGPIPEPLRPLLGNRVFGCDDCQLVCPWNRYARRAALPDFEARHGLDAPDLVRLFAWDEAEYLRRTEGSALRRPGYQGWLRNLAVALGNAPPSTERRRALEQRLDHPSALVREHVRWALAHRPATRGNAVQIRAVSAPGTRTSSGARVEAGGSGSSGCFR